MNREMSQSEVDQEFNRIFPHDANVEMRSEKLFQDSKDLNDSLVKLSDFFLHLKGLGYSDQEVNEIFDLYITEGEIHEF